MMHEQTDVVDPASLDVEIAACVDILPRLAKTLESVSIQMESAVTAVCGHFEEIVEMGQRRLPQGRERDAATDGRTCEELEGERLGSVLHSVMMRLQFQDAVSQRIAHVIAMLQGLHTALDARRNGQPQSADWVGQLANLSNMFDEGARHLSPRCPTNDETENDILF